MKLSKMGRMTAASVLSLAGCLGFTACSRNYTVAFVYTATGGGAAAATNGNINVYQVDYQSGSLVQVADSPVSSGGRNPIALVATPDSKFLYAINHDDNTIVLFGIGTDGKLYAQKTYNSPGLNPVAAAISPDSKFLYVLFANQTSGSGTGTTVLGVGGVAVYPITNAAGGDYSLGTPVSNGGSSFFGVGKNPIGIVVSPDPSVPKIPVANQAASTLGQFVYVIEQDTAASQSNLLAYNRNASTGAITAIPGTQRNSTSSSGTIIGISSGVTPSAIAEDPAAKFLYITDRDSNQVIAYSMLSDGIPRPLPTTSVYPTGSQPRAITIDPRGKFLYVANFNGLSVSPFAIDFATGALSASTGSTTTTVGTGPVGVTVEPARGIYLYTANNLDNTTSGLQLNPSTGSLKNIQNTPFPSSQLPTAIVAVANATHATQLIVQ